MDILFNAFVVLFIVIDPIGVAAVFIGLARQGDTNWQRRMALQGCALATAILVAFYLIGDTLLDTLGIGIPAFRIAGGALLFLLAIDMVFARHSGLRSTTPKEEAEAQHKHDVSVFPLAIPLIAGPGAITTVLLMTNQSHGAGMYVGLLAVLLLVLGLTLLALLYALTIVRLLGETGANVVARLFGLILAALAVQYVLDGIHQAFANGA